MITTLAALALLAADDDWNFKLSLGFDASGDAQTVTNFRVDIEGDQKTEGHMLRNLAVFNTVRVKANESETTWRPGSGGLECGEDRWGLFSDTDFELTNSKILTPDSPNRWGGPIGFTKTKAKRNGTLMLYWSWLPLGQWIDRSNCR